MRLSVITASLTLLIVLSAWAETASDIQSKLKALEEAYRAGILSDNEYTSKKAELEKQLETLDESKQQKLKALEAARQAGILSEEEYTRKKAELLGSSAAASSKPDMTKYQDPQGRFEFRYPMDWKIQNLPQGQGVALTRGKATLSVMILPDGASPQQVLDASAGQISTQWQDYQELRRGSQKVGGVLSPMVEFTGINPQGMRFHAYMVVSASGIKGYMFMLTVSEDDPSSNFAAAQPLWETLLSSFASTEKRGKTYRHATGFAFLYPDDWTITEQEGIIQLAPPNASSTAEGPTELYFLIVVENVSQDGIQRPDDPMVLQYLDQQIWTLSPALQRSGTTLPANMRTGKGVVVDWGATGAGGEVRARAFVGIIENNGVVLIGMGLKEQVEARDQALRQMFSTFGIGDPQPALATAEPYAQAQAEMSGSSAISAGEVGDPNWGFKFRPPEGWKSQKNAETAILGHDAIAGAIFVIPHTAESFQAVQTEMQSGLTDEGVQLLPTSGLQSLGDNILAGEYAGIFDGQQVKARGIGTFSPYGGGAYIVAVTTPDMYGPQLSSAAEAIARGMQYFKVEVSDLMRHFAGTWASATANTLTNITLRADGSYGDTYEAAYSGDLTDGIFKTGDWAVNGQDQSQGRWTVRGNKQQGVIIIKFRDGTENTLQYRVHVEKGETYWNEYWFNGSHYQRIRQ